MDLQSGAGLDDILTGVDAVIDSTNTPARDADEVVRFFTSVTTNLLAAEARGWRRPPRLVVDRRPHTAREEPALRRQAGSGGRNHCRADHLDGRPRHPIRDFAAMVVSWTEQDGIAPIASLLVQPIAPAEVAAILDFVDMARRTLAARGRVVRLVPTWDGPFSVAMAGSVLLPGPDARSCRLLSTSGWPRVPTSLRYVMAEARDGSHARFLALAPWCPPLSGRVLWSHENGAVNGLGGFSAAILLTSW